MKLKLRKYILAALIFVFISSISINANGSLKWYSFKEGYEKAKKEKKFLLVDFYTDWCKWCKVMDEKTYSQKKIIDELNKNFVLVKLNPEKEGTVNYNGETFSNADFARAAQVSGYPATGFFTRSGDFINTIGGYQDVERFSVVLEYFVKEHYLKFGYEDFQLFKKIEEKYNDDKKNADLNFVMGYFYENVFEKKSEAKKHYLKSIETSPKYSEVYSSLYLLAKKGNDKTETDKWHKKAQSAGLKNEEQIMNKLKDVIKLYL
ncbi:MAG: hypothetical protein A2068_12935 [Ignavibacteria bacterium GWB2_35_6b]|nr:MAG: hypothetical protein A2068_12935 [Ignavibacteria bacterium GWB2_35_6b]